MLCRLSVYWVIIIGVLTSRTGVGNHVWIYTCRSYLATCWASSGNIFHCSEFPLQMELWNNTHSSARHRQHPRESVNETLQCFRFLCTHVQTQCSSQKPSTSSEDAFWFLEDFFHFVAKRGFTGFSAADFITDPWSSTVSPKMTV